MTNDEMNDFNTKLSKYLKNLKKDAGAISIKQNYKGTGSRKYRRQLYVRFSDNEVTDLWLEDNHIQTYGVITKSKIPRVMVFFDGRSVEEIYNDLLPYMKERRER